METNIDDREFTLNFDLRHESTGAYRFTVPVKIRIPKEVPLDNSINNYHSATMIVQAQIARQTYAAVEEVSRTSSLISEDAKTLFSVGRMPPGTLIVQSVEIDRQDRTHRFGRHFPKAKEDYELEPAPNAVAASIVSYLRAETLGRDVDYLTSEILMKNCNQLNRAHEFKEMEYHGEWRDWRLEDGATDVPPANSTPHKIELTLGSWGPSLQGVNLNDGDVSASVNIEIDQGVPRFLVSPFGGADALVDVKTNGKLAVMSIENTTLGDNGIRLECRDDGEVTAAYTASPDGLNVASHITAIDKPKP